MYVLCIRTPSGHLAVVPARVCCCGSRRVWISNLPVGALLYRTGCDAISRGSRSISGQTMRVRELGWKLSDRTASDGKMLEWSSRGIVRPCVCLKPTKGRCRGDVQPTETRSPLRLPPLPFLRLRTPLRRPLKRFSAVGGGMATTTNPLEGKLMGRGLKRAKEARVLVVSSS